MRTSHILIGLSVLLALGGCQRTSYSGFGQSQSAPAPLEAQPVGGVQSSDLTDPTMGNQFPNAPEAVEQTAMADGAAAANALDVTQESMVGSWRVANAGLTCDMFLTLTKYGAGSRGGTRGCVGELSAMRSWSVSGKQISVYDANGNMIGRLYKTADNRFDGTTGSGQPFSLSR